MIADYLPGDPHVWERKDWQTLHTMHLPTIVICRLKRAYPTRDAARFAAGEIRLKNGFWMKEYVCKHCGKWKLRRYKRR